MQFLYAGNRISKIGTINNSTSLNHQTSGDQTENIPPQATRQKVRKNCFIIDFNYENI
jgi:hypothetical protein